MLGAQLVERLANHCGAHERPGGDDEHSCVREPLALGRNSDSEVCLVTHDKVGLPLSAQRDGARRSGFAFLPSAPPLHMRFIEATNVYREQAPIVEVRIRYRGRFYTGSQLLSIEDDVIHTIVIPEPR